MIAGRPSTICLFAFCCFLIGTQQIDYAESANILGFLPTMSRSHYIIHMSVIKGLLAKNHNVTVIAQFSSKALNKYPNYNEIVLEVEEDKIIQEKLSEAMKNPGQALTLTISDLFQLVLMMGVKSEVTYNHPRLQEFLKSDHKFDLVVFGMFFSDYFLGIAGHFRCPSVVISVAPALKSTLDLTGSPTEIANVPFISENTHGKQVGFFGRVKRWGLYIGECLLENYINYFINEPTYNRYFPAEKNYPSYSEVKDNVSLVLLNHHFSLGTVRAYAPNMIEIGGIQVKSKPDPLPKDLDDFLKSAKEHGSILFTFGSNIKMSEITSDRLAAILTVFGKLKQKVVMKWELDTPPTEKPANVFISKWLPQDDILAHPSLRLFITHCGLGGIGEAKYHGVPIVGIPFFADQPKNLAEVKKEGWAVELSYTNINEVTFSQAINEVLTNKTYADNVKRYSRLFKDRPLSALDTAVFWVEHVIRHNGARHLRSSAIPLNIIQKNSWDVIAFVAFAIFIIIYLLKLLVETICSFCCRKSKDTKIKLN